MNKLFYVNLYNHKENCHVRIVVTVAQSKDQKDVEQNALESIGKGWKVQQSSFICNTSDDVDMEL